MKNDLWIRALSGLIFLAVMIGAILFSKIAFLFLFFVLTLIGLGEFVRMMNARKHGVDSTLIFLFGSSVYLLLAGLSFYSTDHLILPSILPILIIFPIYALLNLFLKKVNHPGIHAPILSAALLIAAPFGLLNFLYLNESVSLQPVLVFFILLWANDTFAYLIGRFLGRNKLMPNVSPKKTWEGFLGGIGFALLAAFLLKDYSVLLEENRWIYFALIIGVFGTMGDLYESRMKRWAEMKDSGQLMPGHGGVLDRFDGVILSLPVLLFVLFMF